MSFLEVKNVSRSYRGAGSPAVDGVSFDVPERKTLGLVGESGSGKTTLLKILAGLENPDSGEVVLGGEVIARRGGGVAVEKRGIGMVFQHHALFPHLSVGRNVLFGVRKFSRKAKADLLAEMLELVGLEGKAERFPHELSGGERQRVALARALAPDPKLLLLDEPFSSLDTRLRHAVRDETRAILRKRETTAVFVTHDTGDALAVADGIVVLRDGKVQQVGAPPEVYHAPQNAYVASFFGTCNFLPFQSLKHPSGGKVSCHIGPRDGGGLWVRPEDLKLVAQDEAGDALRGTVEKVTFGGGFLTVDLLCAEGVHVEVRHNAPTMVAVGEAWGIVPKG